MNEEQQNQRIAVVKDYFRKLDSGDSSMMDLLTDDIQIYFPKFGVGYGKAEVARAAQGMMSTLQKIEHDFERMNILVAGDHVVVEGFESGISANGTPWPVKDRSEGRYCNVFQFDGLKIKRLHIYTDPDFDSTHEERFLWPAVGMTRSDDI
ncbi:nuclear transport factor 2 family protein [Pantoea agglomerans]|uniref:nuclear transport factor 2 family protein n=1 Tax=Enterobacter agglomerans TaxID=549 RepID=UPI00177A8810|nr:nuclear transport factor 2 family protein [Pantoea agglomerans]